MANFPLVTWQVTVPSFRVFRGATTYDSPVATLWGFETTNTAGAAAATSLAGFLAAQITAAPGLAAVASASYVYSNTFAPAQSPMLYDLTVIDGAGALSVNFYTAAAAAVFGLVGFGPVVTFPASGGAGTVTRSTFNVGGLWMPCGVAGDVRRTTTQRAAVSSSDMSGLTTDIVNWGAVADVEFIASAFPAANLTRWYASTQIYANAANRDVDDPNNTLEGMLAAAATGVTFRIYREAATAAGIVPGTYQVAKMPAVQNGSSASNYASAVDAPRLWDSTGLFFRAS
jgi:hypothetical protein